MLKIKTSLSGNDLNLNLNLKTQSQLSGLYDDIANLVTDQTNKSINRESDQEKRRFTPSNSVYMDFFFWNGSGFVKFISPLDFTNLTEAYTEGYISSFYLIQAFTGYNEDNNTLLNNAYINGFQINNTLTSSYMCSKDYEYSDIHIPISYLNELSGDTFYLYLKYHFFSSKSGKMHLFYNQNTSLLNEEDMYIKVGFNKNNYTYYTPTTTLKEITNVTYINNVNNSIENVVNSRPVYPLGNTFTSDGEYITAD